MQKQAFALSVFKAADSNGKLKTCHRACLPTPENNPFLHFKSQRIESFGLCPLGFVSDAGKLNCGHNAAKKALLSSLESLAYFLRPI